MTTLGNRAKAARRAAQRRLTELGMQYNAATTEQTREAIQARINDINQAISETRLYSNGKRIVGRTKEQRQAAVDKLINFNTTFELPKVPRVRQSNNAFIRNMRSASKGSPTNEISQNAAHAFMRATQKAWEGKGSVNDRYKNIKEYYGTSDLQLIYNAIYFENKEKIIVLNKVEAHEQLTREQKEMMQTMMREDDDLEKRYRKNDEDAPLIGLVASNIPAMTPERFNAIINSSKFWEAVRNNFEDSNESD